jgi:hypothetical protein
MPNMTWKNHKALRCKLTRIGMNHPASLATLLLEAFLENGGRISARCYYGTVHEIKGKKYQTWIDEIRSFGIIDNYKREDISKKGDDWIRYQPGQIIRQYINKEKIHQDEMASMKDVYEAEARFDEKKADRSELAETKKQLAETSAKLATTNKAIEEIAEAVRELQLAMLPPDDEHKKLLREKATQKIALRAVSN